MPTLRALFFVPFQTQNGKPINTVSVLLSNQTAYTQTVFVCIDQVAYPLSSVSPQPITVLHPPSLCKLAANTSCAVSVSVPLIPIVDDAAVQQVDPTPGSMALIVTVSGNIYKEGNKVIASVTGGYAQSSDILTISEPTMFISHADFVTVPHHM